MHEYDSFKTAFMAKAYTNFGETESIDVIELLKCSACLVDIIHGARGLAEDIFANALEIERKYQPKRDE